jgi:phosphoribosylaminoimidazole-succinocarboxamide synthase
VELLHSGKVREVWADGDDLLLVASDRISVFDVVLPTPIPDKGAVLTQLSLWWFERLSDVVAHHVLSSTDVPPQWAGRALRCRPLSMLPVECIARGYLAGSAVADYDSTGAVQGVPLPTGLVEGSALPAPVFTPTTKEAAGSGRHDAPLRPGQTAELVGPEVAAELERLTLEVYRRGAELAAERGILVADTAARRRAPDARLVALLAAGGVAPRRPPAVLRQAVRAGLDGGHRVGPDGAGPGVAPRGRRADQGALRDGVRADHGPALVLTRPALARVLVLCRPETSSRQPAADNSGRQSSRMRARSRRRAGLYRVPKPMCRAWGAPIST